MAPTTRAAIVDPIINSRFSWPSGVMPLGQPRDSASCQAQPLEAIATVPSMAASSRSRRRRELGPHGVTVAPPVITNWADRTSRKRDQIGRLAAAIEYYAA